MEKSNQTKDLSKLRIMKNLIVLSLSYLLLSIAYEGLIILQTTMNKDKGVGTASAAVNYIAYGISSLLFSSFLVLKFGAKNAQLLGILLYLPYIASNYYPTWITMIPSAIFRGLGCTLIMAAQATYINESSVLFCEKDTEGETSKSPSNLTSRKENSNFDVTMKTLETNHQKLEDLSKFVSSVASNLNSNIDKEINGRKSLGGKDSANNTTAYKFENNGTSERKSFSKEMNGKTPVDINGHNQRKSTPGEREKGLSLKVDSENVNGNLKNSKHLTLVNSTKAFFFGIYGFLYFSAFIWSNLISHYVFKTSEIDNFNKTSSCSCGAGFCSTNEECINKSIEDVPEFTRYLLTSLFVACAVIAFFPIFLCLDCLGKSKEEVKISGDHVFAIFKCMKNKDHLLLIPFTTSTTVSRGFYLADFTKSYITCAWNISHVGLITILYGVAASLSSLFSGVLIKFVGRKSVLILCQVINIANFAFLFRWSPEGHQIYLFYLQGCIFGMIAGIYHTQLRAFYGILFQGEEETAFSTCNLFCSIGWSLPFIYNDFFCNSVKIYILLVFSSVGLVGYLLAERSYSCRKKDMVSFQ